MSASTWDKYDSIETGQSKGSWVSIGTLVEPFCILKIKGDFFDLHISLWRYKREKITTLCNIPALYWIFIPYKSWFRHWVAAHICVLSHLRTLNVRAEVRAERIWKCRCDVRACGSFLSVRCAIALLNTFLNKMTIFPVLECLFLF